MTADESVDRCANRADIYFSSNADDVALAQQLCGTCPLTRRSRCAREAIEGDNRFGVWAGVYLPGMQPRYKHKLGDAVERLRRIAGLDRCRQCWRWFRTGAQVDAATIDAALNEPEMPRHCLEELCPDCTAQSGSAAPIPTPVAAAQYAVGQIVDLPPSGDRWMRRYWELRLQGKRAEEGDWLLLTPEGRIEGAYAWSIAVHTFGRTPARFRAMIGAGWSVRRADTRDRLWHRPTDAAAAPVSA